MTFFEDLTARGLVKQVTDARLPETLARESLTLYAGFDPTSDSLHVGNLLQICTLRRFQLAGHRPIAVVGGATGMIGDPSGKADERSLLDRKALDHNVAGIRKELSRFLDFGKGKGAALLVSNADWFENVSYIDFLRAVGKHFTVNHMVAKESVRARLEDREHGISYTEFSYMLLQAYDFFVLNRDEDCRLQIGGSDQWGNITAGCELIRRIAAASGKAAPDVYGITSPLVTKADGSKFGKTESGAVYLSAERTSPYQFYQFFVRTEDADVASYLKYFTFLPLEEIHRLERCVAERPGEREAQKTLARELTTLVHGEKETQKAEKAAAALFGGELQDLDEKTLKALFAEAPATKESLEKLAAGLALIDLLAETGLCPSKGQARKDVSSGGIYVNNERVQDPAATLGADKLLAGRYIVLRKGKKTYHLLYFG